MNYNKYIGKAWTNNFKDVTDTWFILGIRIISVREHVLDNKGEWVWDEVEKRGGRIKRVQRMEDKKKPAILSIHLKWQNGVARYNITAPVKANVLPKKFFQLIKRDKEEDKLLTDCVSFLFENGIDKWEKRYKGSHHLFMWKD